MCCFTFLTHFPFFSMTSESKSQNTNFREYTCHEMRRTWISRRIQSLEFANTSLFYDSPCFMRDMRELPSRCRRLRLNSVPELYSWTVLLNCTPELYDWTVRLNCTTEHCYWTRNAFCLSSPQNSMELRLIILWCTHIFLLESFRAKVVA